MIIQICVHTNETHDKINICVVETFEVKFIKATNCKMFVQILNREKIVV